MFGKSLPSTTRSASPATRWAHPAGNGTICSLNGVPTIVVSTWTFRYGSTRSSAPE